MILVMKKTKKQTNIMAFSSKYTPFLAPSLVKLGPNQLGRGQPLFGFLNCCRSLQDHSSEKENQYFYQWHNKILFFGRTFKKILQ